MKYAIVSCSIFFSSLLLKALNSCFKLAIIIFYSGLFEVDLVTDYSVPTAEKWLLST